MPKNPLTPRLEEMQSGLVHIMAAVKKGDTREAERLLYIVGSLLDDALEKARRG